MQRLLLTPLEAAQALAISRSKLYRLLADGTIPSVRIGANRRVPLQALTDFITLLSVADRDE
jgi:excisionase family DNA binding protein